MAVEETGPGAFRQRNWTPSDRFRWSAEEMRAERETKRMRE
jgi:hypothetical protein